jgi:hypothetical protein
MYYERRMRQSRHGRLTDDPSTAATTDFVNFIDDEGKLKVIGTGIRHKGHILKIHHKSSKSSASKAV